MGYKEIMDELDRIREEIYAEGAGLTAEEVVAARAARAAKAADELGLKRVAPQPKPPSGRP